MMTKRPRSLYPTILPLAKLRISFPPPQFGKQLSPFRPPISQSGGLEDPHPLVSFPVQIWWIFQVWLDLCWLSLEKNTFTDTQVEHWIVGGGQDQRTDWLQQFWQGPQKRSGKPSECQLWRFKICWALLTLPPWPYPFIIFPFILPYLRGRWPAVGQPCDSLENEVTLIPQ